jgi:hypothetical protein
MDRTTKMRERLCRPGRLDHWLRGPSIPRISRTVMRKYRSCLDVYGPRPIATGLAKAGRKVTTADVYPAS